MPKNITKINTVIIADASERGMRVRSLRYLTAGSIAAAKTNAIRNGNSHPNKYRKNSTIAIMPTAIYIILSIRRRCLLDGNLFTSDKNKKLKTDRGKYPSDFFQIFCLICEAYTKVHEIFTKNCRVILQHTTCYLE